MGIELAGTLPLSALNVGLAASVPGIGTEVSKLQADLSDLSPAVQAQIDVATAFPPNPASFAAVITAGLSPAELGAVMAPGTLTFIASEANLAVAAKLGTIRGQIGIVGSVKAALAGGLAAGSITGWSYSGRCNGFGPALESQTRLGFGELGPGDDVQGILVVAQSFASWQQFSKGMAVSPVAAPASPSDALLVAHGRRTGAQWNTGVASVAAHLDGFLAELEGLAANLEATLKFSIGANLPAPSVVVDAGLTTFGAVGIDGLMSNLVSVRTDVTGAIGAVQADVDATVSLSAEISGQLSAGGFSVWTYGGRADGFGKAVTSVLGSGLPSGGGPGAVVYGLAIAGAGPSMGAFGGIFKTA